jgi:arylsulfatase A-like enzyme
MPDGSTTAPLRRRLLGAALLTLALPQLGARSSGGLAEAERPNILLVVVDDLGVDLLRPYSGASAETCTPTLSFIAERGILFENAWADPVCSPTRAQILTGRHGFRTGVGTWVSERLPSHFEGLPPTETTIAETLAGAGYSTGLIGKWHLASGNAPADDPLAHGFGWFSGSIPGVLDPEVLCPTCPPGCRQGGLGYFRWVRSLNGAESCDTRYATSATVSDALGAIGGGAMPEPWFAVVSFNALHSPFHVPPSPLCIGAGGCSCSAPLTSAARQGRAALEAADKELRRLVVNLREASEQPLWVLVVGDNGTPAPVATGPPGSCSDPSRSKGTLYQGGLHVPMLVWTPGLEARRVDALVSATDLFATIAELAGVTAAAEDSVSLVPYLEGFEGSLRSTVFAETFIPNGLPFSPAVHERAVRDDRFKLIRRTAAVDELYDLTADPCEASDLFPPQPGSEAEAAWRSLEAELEGLGVS